MGTTQSMIDEEEKYEILAAQRIKNYENSKKQDSEKKEKKTPVTKNSIFSHMKELKALKTDFLSKKITKDQLVSKLIALKNQINSKIYQLARERLKDPDVIALLEKNGRKIGVGLKKNKSNIHKIHSGLKTIAYKDLLAFYRQLYIIISFDSILETDKISDELERLIRNTSKSVNTLSSQQQTKEVQTSETNRAIITTVSNKASEDAKISLNNLQKMTNINIVSALKNGRINTKMFTTHLKTLNAQRRRALIRARNGE